MSADTSERAERRSRSADALAEWLKKNLFGNWLSASLTVLAGLLVFFLLRGVGGWAVAEADWTVIARNLRLFLIGQYPPGLEWRPWVVVYLAAFLIGLTAAIRMRGGARGWQLSSKALAGSITLLALPLALAALLRGSTWGAIVSIDVAAIAGVASSWAPNRVRSRLAVTGWLAFFPITVLVLRGFGTDGFFAAVGTNLWSGLLLTLLLASLGIVISFPLGVLPALGRQSKMPVIHNFCVFYIELIRGVPLITILFMMQIMLPLFLPQGFSVDRIVRAIVGFVIFTAAYVAENVRGGLQAIPRGQYEAGLRSRPHRGANDHPYSAATGHSLIDSGPGKSVHRSVQGHHPGVRCGPSRSARHRPISAS